MLAPYSGQGHSNATAQFMYDYMAEGLLVIIDQNRGPVSVTNDIRNVLADITETEGLQSLAGVAITYRDTEGLWSRVLVNAQGKFTQFLGFGVRVTEEAEAIRRLRELAN